MSSINGCIFFCWLKIKKRLRILRELQQSNFKFHYRLYILLSFQALFPLIFNTIPAGFTFLVAIFQLEMDTMLTICGSVISFAQVLDPILTACLITDYRKAIVRLNSGNLQVISIFQIFRFSKNEVLDSTLRVASVTQKNHVS